MPQYSIITSAGLDFCLSASSDGPLISVRYFVPVYDPRIDPYVQGEFGAGPASAWDPDDITTVASEADTVEDISASGEVIWNGQTELYDLSPSDQYVLSAGGETVSYNTPGAGDITLEAGYRQTKKQAINMLDNVPLSNVLSGSNVVAPDTYDGTGEWVVYDAGLVAGNNDAPVAGVGKYFDHVDYSTVYSDTGKLRGSFKCRLNDSIGRVKFNRIYLLAVQLDANHQAIGDPVLFAETIIPDPIVKSSYGTGGVDDLIVDVQLDFDTVSGSFLDMIFSTSGDYWQRDAYGVSYQEQVRIGHGLGAEDKDAKTIVETIYSSAYDERALPHLQLVHANVSGGTVTKWRFAARTMSGSSSVTRVELSAGYNSTSATSCEIVPATSRAMTLGSLTLNRRFHAVLGNVLATALTADNIQGIANGTNIGAATISATSISASQVSAVDFQLGLTPKAFVSLPIGIGTFNSSKRILMLEAVTTYDKTTTSAFYTYLKPLLSLTAYDPQLSACVNNTYLGSPVKPFTGMYAASMSATDVTAQNGLLERGRLVKAGDWTHLTDSTYFGVNSPSTGGTTISNQVYTTIDVAYAKIGKTIHCSMNLSPVNSYAGKSWWESFFSVSPTYLQVVLIGDSLELLGGTNTIMEPLYPLTTSIPIGTAYLVKKAGSVSYRHIQCKVTLESATYLGQTVYAFRFTPMWQVYNNTSTILSLIPPHVSPEDTFELFFTATYEALT